MVDITRELYDQADQEKFLFKAPNGINEEAVRKISEYKKEPEWMLQKRLNALKIFNELEMPKWGPDLSKLDLQKICYFAVPDAKHNANNWDDVPETIKKTFDRLGIPEAEKKALAGAGAQYDSNVVYHNLKKELREQGVIFEDMDVAVQKHPELVKKYYMNKCISPRLHKFSALHGAVWSGGTFIYVPKNVKVEQPLQAYFRMNSASMGQFEHTLIIVDEGAEVHYIEGCFTKGTLISTNPDYKKIEDIKEGDKILTSEGDYKKAKDIQRYPYTGKIYDLEIYGDSTQKISTTSEHPFLFVERKYKKDRNKEFIPRWNIPRYFKKGDYLVIPINKKVKTNKEHEFTIRARENIKSGKMTDKKVKVPLTKEFFRLVGYYLAEGSVSNDSYLNFSFGTHEKEYVEDVEKCIKKVFKTDKITKQYHKTNNGVSVVISSVKIARVFKQLGDKSYKKTILPWMMFESLENQKELIKGWFRGDGNYYNKQHKSGLKETFRINTTSEKLARQARDILLRLGVFGFINKRNREKENRKTLYTLGITGEHMIKFGDLVEIKIENKLNSKKRASMFGIDEKFAYVPIKKIKVREVKDEIVYNFGVESHETYTAGGVAVHNCSAPKYNVASLHAGAVEVFVHKNARMRYSSVENWSANTYNLNTKRANVEENGIMEWVSGNLGCLTEDAQVATPDKGFKKISELKTGDYVFSWNPQTNKLEKTKVKKKISTGHKEVFNLNVAGRDIEASNNHPFLKLERIKNKKEHKKGFFKEKWVNLEELKENDVIAISKALPEFGKPYKLPVFDYDKKVISKNQYTNEFEFSLKNHYNKINFPKETNNDLMWFLGLILGDGHIWHGKTGSKINIAIPETSDLRKELNKVVKELFNYEIKYEKDRFVIINSKPLAELLTQIGFKGTAKTKKIPEWIHGIPQEQKMAFLAGYSDADGHMDERGVYLTSINKKILEEVKNLCLSCGLNHTNIFNHGKASKVTITNIECDSNDSFRILLSGDKIKKLPTKSKLKKEKLEKIRNRRKYTSCEGMNFKSKVTEEIGYARISNITSKGIKPTYDIEVEKNHNFIANGIIVHNSGTTMLYPATLLLGRGGKADHISIAYAGKDQNQDTGAKVYHLAPDTSSTVSSKSISKDGGITGYRGLVRIKKGAKNSKCSVICDALMFDNESQSNTYPSIDVDEKESDVVHEASVGRISEDQLFYLQSRGLSEEEALQLIVSGFMEPLLKELPLEYAIEMNRLIELEMEGSLG